MKNGQISRNPGCKAGVNPILTIVDFVRTVGEVMFCYAGPKQVACVPANSTEDFLCSIGLDLTCLRMIREEELAAAANEAEKYYKEIGMLSMRLEACAAAGEAGILGIELEHAQNIIQLDLKEELDRVVAV